MNYRVFIKYFPFILVVYHLVFAWFAYDYVNQNNGDAVRYWFVGVDLSRSSWFDFLYPGTSTIYFLNYPLVYYLNLSPLLGCFLYSAWSGYGFYRLGNLVKPYLVRFNLFSGSLLLLLVLPNAHFWSSLIGKEAILFLPMVILAEGIYRGRYLGLPMILSFLLIAWIRPHLAFVVLLAFVLAFLWKSEAKWKIKSLVLGGILVLGGLVYFLLGKVLGAPEGLVRKVLDLYTVHNSYLKRTSSYVPMEDYVYPYKLFSFYFRPLPFEKSGLLYGIVSFENLLVLIVFGLVVYWILKLFPWMKAGVFLAFVFLFLLFHGSMYAFGYANYGLIIRTKSLVLPFLVLLVMEVRGGSRKKY